MASAVVIIIVGGDAAFPGAGFESAGIGVGVVGIGGAVIGLTVVVFFVEPAAFAIVEPGGDGGACGWGGGGVGEGNGGLPGVEFYEAIGVVVFAVGGVGLIAPLGAGAAIGVVAGEGLIL